MHFSLLVLADGTKTLEEIMAPFYEAWEADDPYTVEMEDDGERYWANPNSKWDWYQVGGRWRGLIEASIGGHGERDIYDFDDRGLFSDTRGPYAEVVREVFARRLSSDTRGPYERGHFDVARVCDITSLDTNMLHDVLTPDGVWHESETYYPNGDDQGRYFVTKEGWHESVWERYIEPNGDCIAIIVDYHD